MPRGVSAPSEFIAGGVGREVLVTPATLALGVGVAAGVGVGVGTGVATGVGVGVAFGSGVGVGVGEPQEFVIVPAFDLLTASITTRVWFSTLCSGTNTIDR